MQQEIRRKIFEILSFLVEKKLVEKGKKEKNVVYMDEFRKLPTWRPGQYSEILKVVVFKKGNDITFDKVKFMELLNEKDMKLSKYGMGFDLHEQHKTVAGKVKTEIINRSYK